MADLPKWVLDLLADLLDEEELHPTLYFTSGAFEGYARYEWCPNVVLEKVPAEARAAARVVQSYRRERPT